ncbi:hypothetical protein FQZ97_457100 [compost metagenome]
MDRLDRLQRLAVDQLHRAREPRGQREQLGRQADRERVVELGLALHAEHVAHLAGAHVDLPEAEDVGHPQVVAVDLQARGHRHLAAGERAQFAGGGVEGLHLVVGHVRDVDRPVGRVLGNGQVVERGPQLLGDGLAPAGQVHLHQLAAARIDHPEVALAVEVGGGRDLEAVGDHGQVSVRRVDLHDLALEPQRAVEQAVGPDLEAVEAAHVLLDEPGRLLAFAVDFPQRIAQEHLRGVELAVPAVEVQRVQPGQVLGEHAQRRAVVLAVAQHAHEVVGPGQLALRPDRDVVGLAFGRVDQHLGGAGLAVDLPQRVAEHGAREQPALRIDGQAVHAREGRRGHEHFGRGPGGGALGRWRQRTAGGEQGEGGGQRGCADRATGHGDLLWVGFVDAAVRPQSRSRRRPRSRSRDKTRTFVRCG